MTAAVLGKSTGLRIKRGCQVTPTKRTELRRIPNHGFRETERIKQILNVDFLAHVEFCVAAGQPFLIPTLYGRDGKSFACMAHRPAACR